jgi:hypothetical protein
VNGEQPSVQWVRPEGMRPVGQSRHDLDRERFAARLVILLLFACVCLALYDMYLLAAGLG